MSDNKIWIFVVIAVFILAGSIWAGYKKGKQYGAEANAGLRLMQAGNLVNSWNGLKKELDAKPTSTAQQLQNFTGQVSLLATETEEIEITGCSPKPFISKIKLNKLVTFRNNDTVEHKLTNTNFTVVVPKKSTVSVMPRLKNPGIYFYFCDSKKAGALEAAQ